MLDFLNHLRRNRPPARDLAQKFGDFFHRFWTAVGEEQDGGIRRIWLDWQCSVLSRVGYQTGKGDF
jgi:hypothetical protein